MQIHWYQVVNAGIRQLTNEKQTLSNTHTCTAQWITAPRIQCTQRHKQYQQKYEIDALWHRTAAECRVQSNAEKQNRKTQTESKRKRTKLKWNSILYTHRISLARIIVLCYASWFLMCSFNSYYYRWIVGKFFAFFVSLLISHFLLPCYSYANHNAKSFAGFGFSHCG